MHGVLYAILMLQNSCTEGCFLPSLETLRSTAATKKIICLFMDVAIPEVAWFVTKKMAQQNRCITEPKNKYTQCY
jgi:hypothetical protein